MNLKSQMVSGGRKPITTAQALKDLKAMATMVNDPQQGLKSAGVDFGRKKRNNWNERIHQNRLYKDS